MFPSGAMGDFAPCFTLLWRTMQQSALSPEFFCDVQPDGERVVARVGGEFDLAVAPHVAATVDELLDVGFARIVLDLRT